MMLRVRNLSRTRSGIYRYRRVVPADCRHAVGKTEWLQSFGAIPDDVATAMAAKLNAEHDELVKVIRREKNGSERAPSDHEQLAMTALGLSDPAQLDALTAVAELLKDLTSGQQSGAVAAKLARVKLMSQAVDRKSIAETIQPRTVFEVYEDDKRLFGSERRDEKVVRIAVEAFVEAVGDVPFREITHRQALAFRDHLRRKGNQGATVNRRLGPMKAIWNRWGKRADIDAGMNPFAGSAVKVAHSRDAKLPFHTSHLAIIDTASFSETTGAQIALMRATCIGPAELAGLVPHDLILNHEIPHIWVRPNDRRALKSGETRERRIPLVGVPTEVAQAALVERYGKHSAFALSAKLNKALRVAGVPESPRLTCYSFRHTLKAALREASAPTFIADRIMGHAGEKGAGELYGASKARLAAKQEALTNAQSLLGQVEVSIFKPNELP
ncbi:MAG: DUF6538 domain-containing protein [Pseudomonadota bacterium]